MANEYASVAELKAALSLTGETFADPDIQLALTAASRAIDNATHRRFWPDADTAQIRYYNPDTYNEVTIDDLITLTAVAIDRTGDNTFTESWTVNTDFILEPLNAAAGSEPYTSLRIHYRSTRIMPWYPRSVRVTGKFGWTAAPDAVKEATMMLSSRLLKRVREAPFGIAGFGVDGSAVRVMRDDPDVYSLICPYTRTAALVA